MIIAVSVQIWEFTASNNFGAARLESSPQSAIQISVTVMLKLTNWNENNFFNNHCISKLDRKLHICPAKSD